MGMTIDEAIKHAEEVGNGCNECAKEHRQLAEWLKDYKRLREQTSWIPVSEKLPEYGKEVLTCSDGGFIEIQSLEDGGCVVWENQKGEWTDFGEIVAWMPLPPCYEPQESEDNK